MSMPEIPEPEGLPKADRDRRIFRFKRIPVRFLLPNVVTLLALCAGVTAIRLGFEGRYELAVGAIIFAIVLDAIDGRLARFLKGQTRFGAELDSLCDFVNFGVAPALLLYMWSLKELKNLGWIVALALAVCCALRLARFNVAIDDPDKPAWMSGYFTGIPAPAGAGLALAPFYMGFLGLISDGTTAAWFVLVYVALVAFGMVSRLPTYSGKGSGQRVSRDLVLPILAGVVIVAVLLIAFTWQVLLSMAILYIALIPMGWRSYQRQKAAWEERKSAPEPEPETV